MTSFCVCVPARDEAARIAILIDALDRQDHPEQIPLALCVNNSSDGTADVARDAIAKTGGRIVLHLVESIFPPALAHAGSARRAAMELGAEILADDAAMLLSTDADCRPPREWLAANLDHAGPMRIVGGRIAIDRADPGCSPSLALLGQRFDSYWAEVRAIEDAIDPRAYDPAPRHGDHTGASLTMSVGLYRRAGGVPLIASGEDRALVAAAVAVGGELIHPLAVWTRASPRIAGRAAGGMALDMARWSETARTGEVPLVPAFRHWRDRARWRRARRRDGVDPAIAEDALPPMPCDMPLPERPAP